jgi:hypothetical protein
VSVFASQSAALDGHLATMAGLPPVAWDNIEYEPVLGTAYLRPTDIRGTTNPVTISTAGKDWTIGIYQIDVFTPAAAGKAAGIELADLLADHFAPVLILTSGGVEVMTLSVSMRTSEKEGAWARKIVEIEYQSYTNKRNVS